MIAKGQTFSGITICLDGGTFTDCFVAWDRDYIQAKALTTHHNLSQGFNEALDQASTALGLDRHEVLSGVDSVRYATTLGTNALIERAGPQVGALVTAGFDATIPLEWTARKPIIRRIIIAPFRGARVALIGKLTER